MGAGDHFTVRLPTKRVAADCLIMDGAGRILVVQPTYKPTWDLPGGVGEPDEAPRETARREVNEELGLVVDPGRLLAVDWVPRDGEVTEVIALLFDGGEFDGALEDLALQPEEIQAARLVTPTEAAELLDREALYRALAALDARAGNATAYLENGRPPAL